MLYIHQSTCISPQLTSGALDLDSLQPARENFLTVIEPTYSGIPPGVLRRMGKAVKYSVGAAFPLLRDQAAPDGIIMGTGNGGLEDCIKFLDQIVQYDEGMLTPGNFVQSTANAAASTISLMTRNQSYNITHVQRGLAFEGALLDAWMQVKETPGKTLLLGGVDEISTYNLHIESLSGSYKKEAISNTALYDSLTPGSIAGEGAAVFRVNGLPDGADFAITAIQTLHSTDSAAIFSWMAAFLEELEAGSGQPDWLLTGENGDRRLMSLYEGMESILPSQAGIARFKHMSGEYPTAVAMATWLAGQLVQSGRIPGHMIKRAAGHNRMEQILIYNTYKGSQHSLIGISA